MIQTVLWIPEACQDSSIHIYRYPFVLHCPIDISSKVTQCSNLKMIGNLKPNLEHLPEFPTMTNEKSQQFAFLLFMWCNLHVFVRFVSHGKRYLNKSIMGKFLNFIIFNIPVFLQRKPVCRLAFMSLWNT